MILVTGGLGFIGSHTVVELLERDYQVLIVDNLSNATIEVLDGIERACGRRPIFEQMDLSNSGAVKALFQKYTGIRGVIHFAASKAVGESVSYPLRYYRNNLTSLIYLLEQLAAYNHAVPFIFSSSCTVYGEPDALPITEEASIKVAISPYANTKQIGEEIIVDTIRSNEKLCAVILRYFNPIGAHASLEIGELPIGIPQNLVPFITQTGIGLREKLTVFGNDYDTKDGTNIRDYIHVVDLAKAHIAALERLIGKKNEDQCDIFNLGTGRGNTVLEVIESFERISGAKLNYEIGARRDGDVVAAYADTTRANDKLGWKAQLSLDDAIASAWAWEKKIRNIN